MCIISSQYVTSSAAFQICRSQPRNPQQFSTPSPMPFYDQDAMMQFLVDDGCLHQCLEHVAPELSFSMCTDWQRRARHPCQPASRLHPRTCVLTKLSHDPLSTLNLALDATALSLVPNTSFFAHTHDDVPSGDPRIV
jgi:hypothetical protein